MSTHFNKALIIDDHAITRIGLKVLLNEMFIELPIDEAKNGEEAESLIMKNDYDFCTLDLNMPETDSMLLLKKIVKKQPKAKVLVISMNNEDIYAINVIRNGAMGFVSKENGFDSIKEAILNVSNNKKYVSERVISMLLSEDKSNESGNPFLRLSEREIEIVRLLLEGLSTKSIALKINLQITTISTHKTRIFEKLQVANTIELYELSKLHQLNSKK